IVDHERRERRFDVEELEPAIPFERVGGDPRGPQLLAKQLRMTGSGDDERPITALGAFLDKVGDVSGQHLFFAVELDEGGLWTGPREGPLPRHRFVHEDAQWNV